MIKLLAIFSVTFMHSIGVWVAYYYFPSGDRFGSYIQGFHAACVLISIVWCMFIIGNKVNHGMFWKKGDE